MVAPRGAVAPRDETRGVRPCLNFHIGLCPAPCAGRITRAAYRKTLERLGLFLRGRKDEVLEGLREAMARAAAALDFEEAARLRDEIAAIESLERRGSLSDGIEPAPPPVDPRRAAGEAGEALGLGRPARTIEGVDVANLGGGDAVGAVVAFADGSPQKGGYRRFRIRGERTRDDYEMIREVVRRRYSRLMRERSSVKGVILPDVILVDGGVGHLRAAAKVVRELGFDVTVAAIAKERDSRRRKKGRGAVDRVLTLARPRGVEFPRGSAALRLLQFVRDEAHRFAQHYHHIRARKRLTDRGR
jgi:excinuclease ABC subunit C